MRALGITLHAKEVEIISKTGNYREINNIPINGREKQKAHHTECLIVTPKHGNLHQTLSGKSNPSTQHSLHHKPNLASSSPAEFIPTKGEQQCHAEGGKQSSVLNTKSR